MSHVLNSTITNNYLSAITDDYNMCFSKLQLMVQKWKDKKARKNTDYLNTYIESLREVQQAHLRRVIMPVKKEKVMQQKETTSGSKRASNSELEQEIKSKARTETTLSGLTDTTSYADLSNLSNRLTRNKVQNRK